MLYLYPVLFHLLSPKLKHQKPTNCLSTNCLNLERNFLIFYKQITSKLLLKTVLFISLFLKLLGEKVHFRLFFQYLRVHLTTNRSWELILQMVIRHMRNKAFYCRRSSDRFPDIYYTSKAPQTANSCHTSSYRSVCWHQGKYM